MHQEVNKCLGLAAHGGRLLVFDAPSTLHIHL